MIRRRVHDSHLPASSLLPPLHIRSLKGLHSGDLPPSSLPHPAHPHTPNDLTSLPHPTPPTPGAVGHHGEGEHGKSTGGDHSLVDWRRGQCSLAATLPPPPSITIIPRHYHAPARAALSLSPLSSSPTPGGMGRHGEREHMEGKGGGTWPSGLGRELSSPSAASPPPHFTPSTTTRAGLHLGDCPPHYRSRSSLTQGHTPSPSSLTQGHTPSPSSPPSTPKGWNTAVGENERRIRERSGVGDRCCGHTESWYKSWEDNDGPRPVLKDGKDDGL